MGDYSILNYLNIFVYDLVVYFTLTPHFSHNNINICLSLPYYKQLGLMNKNQNNAMYIYILEAMELIKREQIQRNKIK